MPIAVLITKCSPHAHSVCVSCYVSDRSKVLLALFLAEVLEHAVVQSPPQVQLQIQDATALIIALRPALQTAGSQRSAAVRLRAAHI